MIRKKTDSFTLIELLVVMAVIAILAGLILSVSGYATNKAASSKAETEIAALSAALESYKADNGIYPSGPTTASSNPVIPANATSTLDARTSPPAVYTSAGWVSTDVYKNASLFLYTQLSGDLNADGKVDASDAALNNTVTPKTSFDFKPNMLMLSNGSIGSPSNPISSTNQVRAIADPWTFSYGYSTANQADSTKGYNPTFDLWCISKCTDTPTPTANPDKVTAKWIKNW